MNNQYRRHGIILFALLFSLLIGSGCATAVNDKQVSEDLQRFENDTAVITKIDILDRQTVKKTRDTIYCQAISQNETAEYTSYYCLQYTYHAEGGWLLENVQRHREEEWTAVPINGVDVEALRDELFSGSQDDQIAFGVSCCEVNIVNQNTDLTALTDEVSVYLKADTDILSVEGTYYLEYIFKDKAWKLVSCFANDDVVYDWKITGLWEGVVESIGTGDYLALDIKEITTQGTVTASITDMNADTGKRTYNVTGKMENLQFSFIGESRGDYGRDMVFRGTLSLDNTITGRYGQENSLQYQFVLTKSDPDYQFSVDDSVFQANRVRLSISGSSAIGLKKDGTVVAKILSNSEQSGLQDIVSVAAGERHVVGLKKDGTVVASTGLYSDGRNKVDEWQNIVAVAAGYEHTVGLKNDGTVVAIGDNLHSQCSVFGWRNVIAISAAYYHTVGLLADGTVVATGRNLYGSCDLLHWEDIIAVYAGYDHTVGLKADGTVVAAGDNHYGQCDVTGWSDIVAVAAGKNFTVGLKSDGTVVAAGDNRFKQCDVSGWGDIVAISAGFWHTAGIRKDGTVCMVGHDELGYQKYKISQWVLDTP